MQMENTDNATAQEYVVELENVVISYDEEPVLKDVSLRLGSGDFVYLIGKSGAGKTSLLRSLYADQPIESGVARVCGFGVVNMRRRHVPQLRRKIGIVFQNFRLLKDRSVSSNLEFVLRATGWKKRNEIQNQGRRAADAPVGGRAAACGHSTGAHQQSAAHTRRRAYGQPRPCDVGGDHAAAGGHQQEHGHDDAHLYARLHDDRPFPGTRGGVRERHGEGHGGVSYEL